MNNLPPHNIELEESVLATILAHPEDDLFELMPVDFYKSANACVYRICLGLWNAKLPVDISSVGNELKKNDTEVPLSYLSTLMDAPPIISTEYSVNQIRGFANLRRMIELSNSLMKQCYRAKPEDVENIVDNLQRDSLKIGTTKTENLVSIGSIITDAVEQ
jgi:replicative DNA helicase